jgi:hypothetical protein
MESAPLFPETEVALARVHRTDQPREFAVSSAIAAKGLAE